MRSSILILVGGLIVACGTVDDGSSTSSDELNDAPDYADATFESAARSNYRHGRNEEVQFVVIHDIEGSARSGINTFKNSSSGVSAHYVVGDEGEVVQMVREENTAWHAGHSFFNAASIGIEHAGYAENPRGRGDWEFPDDLYEASAKLVAYLATKYRIPVDRQHIIGHYQVPARSSVDEPCSTSSTSCGGSGRHGDPGDGGGNWKWDSYMERVQRHVTRLSGEQNDAGTDGGDGGGAIAQVDEP